MDPDAGGTLPGPHARREGSDRSPGRARAGGHQGPDLRDAAPDGAPRRAASGPLILEVEDLHWVDRTSEEYLAFLAESLLGAPILLIATYRPGYRPPWSDRSFATQLSLGRLTGDESLAIVQARSCRRRTPSPLARADPRQGGGQSVLPRGADPRRERPGPRRGPARSRTPSTASSPRASTGSTRTPSASSRPRRCSAGSSPRALLAAIWDGPAPVEPAPASARAAGVPLRAHGRATTPCTSSSTRSPRTSPRRRSCPRGGASSTAGPARRSSGSIPTASPSWRPGSPTTTSRRRRGRPPPSTRGGPPRPLARSSRTGRRSPATTRPSTAAQRAGLLRRRAALGLHEGRADVHAVLGDFEPARADYETALAPARESGAARSTRPDSSAPSPRSGAATRTTSGVSRSVARRSRSAERGGDTPEGRRVAAEARLRAGLMELNLARLSASRAGARARPRALPSRPATRAARAAPSTPSRWWPPSAAISTPRSRTPRRRCRAWPRAGDRQTEASCMSNLAFVLLYRGRRAEGESWIQKALAAARAIGARAQEAYVRSITARARRAVRRLGSRPAGSERRTGHRPRARTSGVDGRRPGEPSAASTGTAATSPARGASTRRCWRSRATSAPRSGSPRRWARWARIWSPPGPADGTHRLGEAVELAGEAVKFARRPRARPGRARAPSGPGRRGARIRPALPADPGPVRGLRRRCPARRGGGAGGARPGRRGRDAPAPDARPRPAPSAPRRSAGARVSRSPGCWTRPGARTRRALARADARRLLEKVAVGLTGAPDLLRGFEASPAYREAAAR